MNNTLAGVSTVVSIITGALVTWNTIKMDNFDQKLQETKNQQEFNFKIYESVTKAVEKNSEKEILAIKVIVKAMASDDVREGFLKVLENGEENIYLEQEAEVIAPPLDIQKNLPVDEVWKQWNFDFFWCSTSGTEAQVLAQKLEQHFNAQNVGGRNRVRILPKSKENSSRFGETAPFQLRVDAGPEYENADQMVAMIKSAIQVDEVEVKEVRSSAKIPGYVSIFICPK